MLIRNSIQETVLIVDSHTCFDDSSSRTTRLSECIPCILRVVSGRVYLAVAHTYFTFMLCDDPYLRMLFGNHLWLVPWLALSQDAHWWGWPLRQSYSIQTYIILQHFRPRIFVCNTIASSQQTLQLFSIPLYSV